MTQTSSRQSLPRAQILTQQALAAFERFMHIQASSGVVLLLAALAALIWANSSFSDHYFELWHTPVGLSWGSIQISQSLHFWINDGLMTLFFFVVGLEVRYEMHAGSLSSIRAASLPICAALGGVVVPALIYVALNHQGEPLHGWAVPTATDIAFAVGLLALLGRGIAHNIRVFLLALAIIDDIVAVLIIAVFYTSGLDYTGFLVAAAGLALVFGFQRMGISSAWPFVLPGVIVWLGVLQSGAHPTLAGVLLGLITPMRSRLSHIQPIDKIRRLHKRIVAEPVDDPHDLIQPLAKLHRAQRDLLPPAVRLQGILHPWVAFLIMPIFALANAGVNLTEVDFTHQEGVWLAAGVTLALVLGKPLGIVCVSWLTVRLGLSRLPAGVDFGGILLIGLFAGIGFTMSIFIAMLAFQTPALLAAAKLGVLLASVLAAILGLSWGAFYKRRYKFS